MADTLVRSIQFKRGKKEALERVLVGANRPLKGEPILEYGEGEDLNKPPKLKIGDGKSNYADLPYFSAGSDTPQESIVFGNHYEFPEVGKENILYVAKDEKKTYIWDNEVNHYVAIVAEAEVREINGGGADSFK